MDTSTPRSSQRIPVLRVGIDPVSWPQALEQIYQWASRRESRYVCITNVHSVITAGQDDIFFRTVAEADLVTPDGAPVAWMLRKLGVSGQERINGPDLMWKYCAQAESRKESIFLYGGHPRTLQILQEKLHASFPSLEIAGAYSPPFRPLSFEEQQEDIDRINQSGAGTVWVSLGCPKQETWMASQKGRIHAVMIGVGAAFDYHAGTVKRAPMWMQRTGLEWLHRLVSEPRRLWKRYLITNTLFVLGVTRQLLLQTKPVSSGRNINSGK